VRRGLRKSRVRNSGKDFILLMIGDEGIGDEEK